MLYVGIGLVLLIIVGAVMFFFFKGGKSEGAGLGLTGGVSPVIATPGEGPETAQVAAQREAEARYLEEQRRAEAQRQAEAAQRAAEEARRAMEAQQRAQQLPEFDVNLAPDPTPPTAEEPEMPNLFDPSGGQTMVLGSQKPAQAQPTQFKASEELHKIAQRVARTIVSDIKIYNPQKIEQGIAQKNLYDLLKKEFDNSIKTYEERADPQVRAESNYLYEYIVKSLCNGDPSVLGPNFPIEKFRQSS
jgi:type II secretory pathway pseudopilin PulG